MGQGITIDQKLCDRVSGGRTFWIMYTFGRVLVRQGIIFGYFATRYRVWRDLLHDPSLPLSSTPWAEWVLF